MYSGESEAQARRKTLAVLLDESRKVLDCTRELKNLYDLTISGETKNIDDSMEKIKTSEDEVENNRRALTRELAEIGTLMMNREDFLSAAYEIEEIAGYTTGTAFRLSIIKPSVLKKNKMNESFLELIDMCVELVQRLSEMVRSLSINPASAIEIANVVHKIEKESDDKYRELVSVIMKKVTDPKDVMLLVDLAEGLEDMADVCSSAADSITIVALGL